MEGKEVNDHVIELFDVTRDFLDSIEQKIKKNPCILHKSAGDVSCCIFKVPQSLLEVNPNAYQPHTVSIGPYHHGKDHLKMIEEHKWRFLGNLLSRAKHNGKCLEDYFKAISSMECRARECYSSNIHELKSDKFLEMLVLDGCFILEFLRVMDQLVLYEDNDPIFKMIWVLPFVMRDLIKLENQIPFCVLQCLYDLSKEKKDHSLCKLFLRVFNSALHRPEEVIKRYYHLEPLHLLDLLRSSLLPAEKKTTPKPETAEKAPGDGETSSVLELTDSIPETSENMLEEGETNLGSEMIQCATKLYQNGINFKVKKSDTFLDISFSKGVIEIPTIVIDDMITSLFLNSIAFEQCHGSQDTQVSEYAVFLAFVIHSKDDVGLLRDKGIIQNLYGTDENISHFFNNLGKDVSVDIQGSYLAKLFEDINTYYKKSWRVQWASLKHTYFKTTWTFLSALAALILLLLTLAQTFFSVFGYFQPP